MTSTERQREFVKRQKDLGRVKIQTWIDSELSFRLEEIGKAMGLSKSDIIRRLLESGILLTQDQELDLLEIAEFKGWDRNEVIPRLLKAAADKSKGLRG